MHEKSDWELTIPSQVELTNNGANNQLVKFKGAQKCLEHIFIEIVFLP